MPEIPPQGPPPDHAIAGDGQGADPALESLRSLPDRYRAVLAADRDRTDKDLSPDALEEAAHTRDLFGTAADRVERLLEDSRPVADSVPPGIHRRGPNEWDAEAVLEVMDTNAERVARLVEAIPETAGGRAGVREGLESITHEIVNEAASQGERWLRNSERVIEGKPDGGDGGDGGGPQPGLPSR